MSGAVGPEAFVAPFATDEICPGMSSERAKSPASATYKGLDLVRIFPDHWTYIHWWRGVLCR